MNHLVSVVIPIYNTQKYLDRCVDSVVNQTYNNLEIILVDDGSSDDCPKMCDTWALKDGRIKVMHKANAGLGMARNTGIDNASGEYICFFDSDDYIAPGTVEKCVTAMTQNDSDAVIFGCVNDYGDKKIPQKLYVTKNVFTGTEVQEELIPSLFTYGMGFGISCCMKMFRLDAIRSNLLRFMSEREIISEDALFIIELFTKIKSVSIIAENLYYYYKSEGSLTNSYRADRQEKNDIFIEKALETAQNAGLSENVYGYIKARYHMYTIAAMKQILSSSLSYKEKDKELGKIFRSSVFRNSIDNRTLSLHNRRMRVFFGLLRFRLYPLCKMMLQLKLKNQK